MRKSPRDDWGQFRYGNENGANGHVKVDLGSMATKTELLRLGAQLHVTWNSFPVDPLKKRELLYACDAKSKIKPGEVRTIDGFNPEAVLTAAREFGVTSPFEIKKMQLDLDLPAGNALRSVLPSHLALTRSGMRGIDLFPRSPLISAGRMGGKKSRSGGKDQDD